MDGISLSPSMTICWTNQRKAMFYFYRKKKKITIAVGYN